MGKERGGRGGRRVGGGEKMRVIVEDQRERIRLNHLLSNDLRGQTQLAAEPRGLVVTEQSV